MNSKQKARVRRLIASGSTMSVAAERAGVSYYAVWRYCRAAGLDATPSHGRLPESLRDIKVAIATLGSVDAVASEYGVTPQAVYYRLSKEDQ